jgi:hypothetical protein
MSEAPAGPAAASAPRKRAAGRLRGALPFLLPLAAGVHLALWASLPTGLLDRLFNDATHRIGKGGDFFQFYQAGANLLRGLTIYQRPELDRVPFGPLNKYPPLLPATLGVASQLLDPEAAYAVWVACVGAMFGVMVWLFRRLVGPEHHGPVALFCLAYTPFYLDLYHGQTNTLMALLVTLVLLSLARGPRPRDGVVLALSLNVKLNTLLLAPAFLRREHLRWLATAAGLSALLFAPYFAFFPDDLAFFVRYALGPPTTYFYQAGNVGSYPLLQEAVYAFTYRFATVARVQQLWTLGVLLAAGAVHLRARGRDPLDLAALWLATYFLAFKFVWEHHLVMALPLLALEYKRGERGTVALLWTLLAVPTVFVLVDHDLGPGYKEIQLFWTARTSALYHACKLVPLAALWVVVAARLLGRRVRPPHAALGMAVAWALGALFFVTRPASSKDECALALEAAIGRDVVAARDHFERAIAHPRPWRDAFVRYGDMLAGLGDEEGAKAMRARAADVPK